MRRLFILIALSTSSSVRAGEPPTPQALEFFESRVRPILVDSCFGCHGEKKQKAGLRLDSRQAVLNGSDIGPVVVPGDPAKSSLVKAIHYDGDTHMPPTAKLPAASIEALTTWVKMGLPYPEAASRSGLGNDPTKHWAFQPVRDPALPSVHHPERVGNSIDRFVLAKLEAQGLSLAPQTDRRTLLRRVYYDLVGLPPSAEQFAAFENDTSPDAFTQVVDRLLASPQYGERWARYWLDVARYSDTKGYVFQEDRNYPYAWTYREWVIRALNDDMPYDQFVVRQLAADRLPGEDRQHLAAMGFLTLGRRFLNNIHDITDDRIDVVSRSLLGLTVTCARCHDHKFDPIPTKDYYSLYGVFASSVEPKELPLIGDVQPSPELASFEKEVQKRQAEVTAFVEKRLGELVPKLREPASITAYLIAVHDAQGKSDQQIRSLVRERELTTGALARWKMFLEQAAQKHPGIFLLVRELAAIRDADFAAKAPMVIANALKGGNLNPLLADAFRDLKPATFKDVATAYGNVLGKALREQNDAANPAREVIVQVLTGPNGPLSWSAADAEGLFNRADRNKFRDLQKRIDAFRATNPVAPPRAMVLNDSPRPISPVVFLRGNPNNRGPAVPRQFLQVIAGPERKPFTDGSGRLELAQAIVAKDNPLTARVMVNRIWLNHFGAGLVRTPSDFGTRSDPPTHPELLDWLARRFVDNGWSIKKLHRLIVMSQTFQQSSTVSADLYKLDPENRLLGRMTRRRLDFEALRDSLLASSGQIDDTLGGRSVDLFKEPFTHRRTVYGFVDRQNLPGTLRSFDFASPDTHSPQRFTTTVPPQALFLMNSPFVVAQAKSLVARTDAVSSEGDRSRRVAELYRFAYGRLPKSDEAALALAFVQSPAPEAAGLSKWEELAQVLLLSNEFAFVD